jgi:hypothetical protein
MQIDTHLGYIVIGLKVRNVESNNSSKCNCEYHLIWHLVVVKHLHKCNIHCLVCLEFF